MYLLAKNWLGRTRKTSAWMWALLCLVLLTVFQVRTHHLDDRLYFWIKTSWHTDDWQERSVWLPGYRVELDAKAVSGVDSNLSGLTFDPDLNLLWAVTNGPNELLALSRDGDVERRYSLDGFHDVEAVSYAGNGQLVIAEERRQSLVIVDVPIAEDGKLSPDRPLSRDQYPALTLALGKEDNKGLEGLAYDLKGDRLFVTKERDPRQLLEVSGLRASLAGGFSLHVRDLSSLVKDKVFATDLSSVVFDQQSGHLILLSDESKLLIEMTDEGKVVSFRSLARGFGRFLPFMTGSCRPAGCALKRPGNWGLSVREQVFTLRDRLKVIHIAVESFEDLSDFVWVSSTKNYAEGHVHVGSRPNPLRNQVETRTLHNQINCFLKGNDLFPEAIYDGYF